ncbi:transposase [Burkholderia aenigmatica]|jgi:hypothetical protein|uniref:Transposase n=1 Tax=Burkholderia aenigmatica TaxID=2015348 RepID=A0A6P2SE17_9BURK|nr:transposase [Burkholderia aenigmatica]
MDHGLDANTSQVRAALMTHQDVADGAVLAELLDRIPVDELLEAIGGDGAYDPKACQAAIAARVATPTREVAAHCPTNTSGAAWRNDAADAIVRLGRRESKKCSGYYRRSFAENAIDRFKTLAGNCLWARHTDSQANEVPSAWAC